MPDQLSRAFAVLLLAFPGAALPGAALPGAALPGAAWAQGNDSTTTTMAPHTSPRPTALSQSSVTSVPGGKPVAPRAVTLARPAERGGPLDLPGSVKLASPARLACGDIADRSARTRCEGLRTMPAPPRGMPPEEVSP